MFSDFLLRAHRTHYVVQASYLLKFTLGSQRQVLS